MFQVVRWKIDGVTLPLNPSSFTTPRSSGAEYMLTIYGDEVKVNPVKPPKNEFTIIWPRVEEALMEFLRSKAGKKVTVVTHRNETYNLHFDDVSIEETAGGKRPKFFVRVVAREV